MSRYLLAALLLIVAATAQAITPARQDADGGGSDCPNAEPAAEEAPAADEPVAGGTKPAAPAPSKGGGTMARPKAGARWHSFLPGMFK